MYPILFSLDSFEPKSKATTPKPSHSQDNYSYFHFGKPSSQQKHSDKVKTFAFPVTNLPTTTQRNPFAFNSVGGFFNNNQGFLPLKPVAKASTPAPIYEGGKSASSYDSRYTTASPIKALPSTPYPNNPFLNNLAFNPSPNVYNFNFNKDKTKDENVVQITTKKPSFTQYPIPSSTPKYIQSYTTPNQLFDFDKFVAGIREVQRQQNSGKFAGINHNQLKNNQSAVINQNVRYQQVFTSPTTSTTASPDEDDYYYEDDEEEEDETAAVVDHNLTKFKTQSAKPSINTYNRKPVINSNSANDEEDFYYDDDDEEDEEEFRPPPIIKPKYFPMSETMAPRPINVTTLRPYYVSGQTFSTVAPPASTTSIIPSIIKFPDDVFQAIRPFTSPAPNLINSQKVKPNKNYEITKPTTTTTTSERPSTKRTKIKSLTKATTNKLNSQPAASSTTVKPNRQTTRRKIYTIRPNRGNLKFKVSTKRPDLTRLEIDEKLPNR